MCSARDEIHWRPGENSWTGGSLVQLCSELTRRKRVFGMLFWFVFDVLLFFFFVVCVFMHRVLFGFLILNAPESNLGK